MFLKTYLSLLIVCTVVHLGYGEEALNIPSNKKHVIPVKIREQVLKVANTHLSEDTNVPEIEVEAVARLQNPFTLEDETAIKASTNDGEDADRPAAVVYDTASILDAIANSLTKQIRGTLARGDQYYLQLQGGCLVKSGVSFPARIPEIPNEVYQVKLTNVSSGGYTIELNGESKAVLLNQASEESVRFSK